MGLGERSINIYRDESRLGHSVPYRNSTTELTPITHRLWPKNRQNRSNLRIYITFLVKVCFFSTCQPTLNNVLGKGSFYFKCYWFFQHETQFPSIFLDLKTKFLLQIFYIFSWFIAWIHYFFLSFILAYQPRCCSWVFLADSSVLDCFICKAII